MATSQHSQEPEWEAPFLSALRASGSIRGSARAAGISTSSIYSRRDHVPHFAEQMRVCLAAAQAEAGSAAGCGTAEAAPAGPRKFDRFIAELAETSNVTGAAAAAGVTPSQVYKRRRTYPDFARRWFEALAEGYDNLEMELLGRLRAGENADGGGGVKFDTATALRCLTAHRESVAREKGRRTLAAEVTTIAAINAKIDAMRQKQEDNRRAIAAARRSRAKQGGVSKTGGAAREGRGNG